MKLGFELLQQNDGIGRGWVLRANNENPYGKEELLNALADANNESKIDMILSIPSPYARFHVTETAFIEGKARDFNVLPPVYKRAISHCLDVFELFFLNDGVKLSDLDIHVNKYNYKTLQDIKSSNVNVKQYLNVLELYRQNYGREKFNNFYRITKVVNGVEYLIASTSPFSIFSTPEDICEECQIPINNPERILFAKKELGGDNSQLWTGIENRSSEFQKFIYSLLRRYNHQYEVLWEYLERRVRTEIKNEVNSIEDYFKTKYSRWQIEGEAGVPIKVSPGAVGKFGNVEILPLGYDTFVFENFVDTAKAHDYSLVEKSDSEFYNCAIENRRNNFNSSENPAKLSWITIHDLLEDDVFVTHNHMDEERFLALTDDGNEDIDAIIPFKKKFFELFDLYDQYGKLLKAEDIKKWVTLRFTMDAAGNRKLYITLSLPIQNKPGERVLLTKIYDNSHIHELDIDFGIYPFQQVTSVTKREVMAGGPDNFYRIMLYLTNSRLERIDSDIKLYARDYANNTNLLVDKDVAVNEAGMFHVQRHSTILEKDYQSVPNNLYYMSLESCYGDLKHYRDVRFDFVELTIDKKRVLIVPRFDQCTLEANNSNAIAVDLGTSNTYVAYGSDAQNCHAFEDEYTNLVGKLCYKRGVNVTYDFTQDGMHQATEFIPTEFAHDDAKAHFPVQTIQLYQRSVISDQNLDGSTTADGAPLVSLFTMNIPFLYSQMGCRIVSGSEVDTKLTNFKWFSSKRGELAQKNAFILFVDQLCFMLRNKFIARNFNLANVQLIWTYPLAIAGTSMIDTFDGIWKNAYKKYFNDQINNLHKFTESETPIESSKYANTPNGVKVGIDIGGGTTDMIIYEPQENTQGHNTNIPTLASSFSFAGNMLFGRISGKDAAMLNRENIWYHTMKSYVQGSSTIQGDGVNARIVDIDENKHNITDFMDYIFSHVMTKDEVVIRQAIDQQPALKYIGMLHISSLIWEVAKICKARLENKVPKYIVFSGNGSKLILMSLSAEVRQKAIEELVKIIFGKVYDKNPKELDITVELLPEPKRATAEGALNIISKRIADSKVNGKNYMQYLDKLYSVSEDLFGTVNGASDFSPSSTSTDDNDSSSLFGDMFSTETSDKSAVSQKSTSPNEVNDACPDTNTLLNDWEKIADCVGVFFDYFSNIAATPIGGRISKDGTEKIRRSILGSPDSYKTEKMKEYISYAKNTIENRIRMMSSSDNVDLTVRESVFLAVIAQILAEIIKYFGNKMK